MILVERAESFRHDAITGSVCLLGDRCLKPTSLDPADDFAATHMQYLGQRFQGKAITTNLADSELSSLEGVAKSFCASLQPLCNFLHGVFREQFPRLVQFFLPPAPVVDFRLDAVLDDEAPTLFLRPASLALEPANELGKFVSRKHPGLFRQGDCFRSPCWGGSG